MGMFLFMLFRWNERNYLHSFCSILRHDFCLSSADNVCTSIMLTGNPIPQLGFGDKLLNSDIYLIDKLDKTIVDLGSSPYTSIQKV